MELDLYQVDAFADKSFSGNPAAICPLQEWLPEATMQSIAAENNLSETAFYVPNGNGFEIRWFTPGCEVDLCGHATLASAWVLFNLLDFAQDKILFSSKSGPLAVERDGELLKMDFPAQPASACDTPTALVDALGITPQACYLSEDLVAVFNDEKEVAGLEPNMALLKTIDVRGVIVTAASANPDTDFVARFFAPNAGIDEDPVTGSAYTKLAPYWADKLGKTMLSARQISPRGGNIQCELSGDRVFISGKAVKYLQGKISI